MGDCVEGRRRLCPALNDLHHGVVAGAEAVYQVRRLVCFADWLPQVRKLSMDDLQAFDKLL